jgi:formylglycine-generating enzyme required for sulfatase activity
MMSRRRAAASAAAALVILGATACRAPRPGSVWQDPVTQTRFRLLAPAQFMMGTPPDEHLRETQEVRHPVRLTRPFLIAETEVTQEQWFRVMGNEPSHFTNCYSCPVESVNWHDVQKFIERLNRSSTPGFRLPTEAEWEYACRAGGSAAFGNQSSLTSDAANINGQYPYLAPQAVHRRETTTVGRFPPNAFGLFDMSGNVWEWTEDEHCPYPETLATDPVGACGSPKKVIRGGSWAFDGGSARCGVRYTHRPQDLGNSLGFRLVHDPVR